MGLADRSVRRASFSCSEIEAFAWLSSQAPLRAAVLQRFAEAPERVREAQALIDLHVLSKIRYDSDDALLLRKLRHQGVGRDELLVALAQAWLDDTDRFEVGLRSRWTELLGSPALIAVSFLVALAFLVGGALWLWRVNRELESYFLVLPPLLGVVGYAVGIVVYRVLRRVLPNI